MVIVPEEAAVVRDIFDMTINGMGTYVIARELNDRGLQSKKGAKWHPSTVRGILQNEKYIGKVAVQYDDPYKQAEYAYMTISLWSALRPRWKSMF